MSEKQIRLIVTDLDGTLLNEQMEICEENIRALKDAAAHGVHIAFCSGRPPHDVSVFAVEAGLSPYILGTNGTCCFEKPLGPIWREDCLPEDVVRKVWAEIGKTGLVSAIFSGHMLVLNAGPSVYQPPYHAWGTYLLDPRAGYEMCFSSEKFEEAIARGVNKMMVHDPYRTDDRLTRLFKTLPEAVPGPEYTSSWVTNIEINPPTMNKGKSVIRLAEHLGVAMDEVMTLGDNDNDLPMLEVAGYSVAMGNGTPNAIAAAKYITCSNRQAGLAKAIRKLVFHEDIPCVRRMQ